MQKQIETNMEHKVETGILEMKLSRNCGLGVKGFGNWEVKG